MMPLLLKSRLPLAVRRMMVVGARPLSGTESKKGGSSSAVEHHDDHHLHGPAATGPPITFDYMPIPCQPYKTIYGELQRKFNLYLVIGFGCLASAVAFAWYNALLPIDMIGPPETYRFRNNPNYGYKGGDAEGGDGSQEQQ